MPKLMRVRSLIGSARNDVESAKTVANLEQICVGDPIHARAGRSRIQHLSPRKLDTTRTRYTVTRGV